VHPTGGSLRVFGQFAWLEVGSGKMALSRPAHQPVTQAVGQVLALNLLGILQNQVVFQFGMSESSKSGFGFVKVKSFSGGIFPSLSFSNSAFVFFSHSFIFGFVSFLKSVSWF